MDVLPKTRIENKHWLVLGESLQVPPGDYVLTYEILDGSGTSGSATQALNIRDFIEPKLDLSDVLVVRAHRNKVNPPKSTDDYALLANPEARWFGKHLPIYFEVYGLTTDDRGRSRCEMTMEVHSNGIWRAIESERRTFEGPRAAIGWRIHKRASAQETLRLTIEDIESGETVSRAVRAVASAHRAY